MERSEEASPPPVEEEEEEEEEEEGHCSFDSVNPVKVVDVIFTTTRDVLELREEER